MNITTSEFGHLKKSFVKAMFALCSLNSLSGRKLLTR